MQAIIDNLTIETELRGLPKLETSKTTTKNKLVKAGSNIDNFISKIPKLVSIIL